MSKVNFYPRDYIKDIVFNIKKFNNLLTIQPIIIIPRFIFDKKYEFGYKFREYLVRKYFKNLDQCIITDIYFDEIQKACDDIEQFQNVNSVKFEAPCNEFIIETNQPIEDVDISLIKGIISDMIYRFLYKCGKLNSECERCEND